jgi:hypothetical protein
MTDDKFERLKVNIQRAESVLQRLQKKYREQTGRNYTTPTYVYRADKNLSEFLGVER